MNVLVLAAGVVAAVDCILNRSLLAAAVSLFAFGHIINLG